MISDFLNVRESTRKLTEEDFEALLPVLAEELTHVDYKIRYTNEQLKKDWESLKNFSQVETSSNSTVRVGMKLCEHFFTNFYNIKNAKGQSFENSWTKDNLVKVLRWNRKCHSTPYLSEIKRGIYFCTGLTKNTMFRPHLAKAIVSSYPGETVLDPCAGWGGRMLGTVAAGKKYIAFEPNVETYNKLIELAEFLDIKNQIEIYNVGSEHMNSYLAKKVDIILTSPPYFNLEIYCDGKAQSENQYSSYESWRDGWMETVITTAISNLNDSGVSCWNVHNVGKMKMIEDVRNIHTKNGFVEENKFCIGSSKRQAHQGNVKNEKNIDVTICYKK
jgi:tRNA1(Val) A37 N6-methylase TrmN6